MTNQFRLFAVGDDFDVDAYLPTTILEFDTVWRRGDIRGCEYFHDRYPTSGIAKSLGDGLTLTPDEQDDLAIEYLKHNVEPLRELAVFPGVETVRLGLHWKIDNSPGIISTAVRLSPQLMLYALKARVEPLIYLHFVQPE